MTGTSALPLFPLNTVLFPGGPLALRIFEPRYVDMVGRCMREGTPFGVLLILDGAEVGELRDVAEIGTTASIVDFTKMPDGLLGITCRGERRFRVLKRWREGDGLNVADVEYLPSAPAVELPDEYRHLGEVLRKVFPELGDTYVGLSQRFDDAAWVGYRLAELLPISMAGRRALLELEDPRVLLSRIAPLLRSSGVLRS